MRNFENLMVIDSGTARSFNYRWRLKNFNKFGIIGGESLSFF
jgi:hypothetical protein